MPSLMLSCRHCQGEFPSGIGVNEEALHGVTMAGLHHRCPHCGTEEEYYTNDYHLALVSAHVEAHVPGEEHAPAMAERREEANRMAGFGVGA
ncbi:MAG TPA: hypothetical protein VGU43_01995 [Thermoplasmata archaeon]|nr:hypothetical protein [Thermoplasmata archaeon]